VQDLTFGIDFNNSREEVRHKRRRLD